MSGLTIEGWTGFTHSHVVQRIRRNLALARNVVQGQVSRKSGASRGRPRASRNVASRTCRSSMVVNGNLWLCGPHRADEHSVAGPRSQAWRLTRHGTATRRRSGRADCVSQRISASQFRHTTTKLGVSVRAGLPVALADRLSGRHLATSPRVAPHNSPPCARPSTLGSTALHRCLPRS